tara:strand:- start:1840 stop:2331 length:492 start_codon:yes stop_codon:yes gene_type:complete
MKKIKWELPFKNMHYLQSLTKDLARVQQIILLTAKEDAEGNVEKVSITLRDVDENTDNLILNIGAIIGAHSVGYSAMIERERELERIFISEAFERMMEEAANQEQENDGAPKGPDYVKGEVVVEEVIKEIVEIKEKAAIAPKTKKKDNNFVTKLRVILKNFQK